MKYCTIENNFYSGENLCVCCGKEIPEGRLVCFSCEHLGESRLSENNTENTTANPDSLDCF